MTFSCQRCGECCSSMGEIISIQKQIASQEFRILITPTGEEYHIEIDTDKQDLFRKQDSEKSHPMACPFLRETPEGMAICTVHHSRPEVCRQYSCFRILILDDQGKKVGRVMDASRYCTSMDEHLNRIWRTEISGVTIPDETAWEEYVDQVFSRAGFRVIR